jgi:hypothetical protein
MHQNWSGHEGVLEKAEGGTIVIGGNPRGPFTSETCQGDHNVRILMNEVVVKVHEAQEGLNVLDFMGLGPILDGLHFLCGHGKSLWRKAVPEVLCRICVELALLRVGI